MNTALKIRHVARLDELGKPRETEVCFDAYAPFPVRHAGKLALPEDLREFEVDYPPPRDHCVVHTDSGLGVVRFTPFHVNAELNAVLGAPERLADLHARHLAKLGEFGLRPWIRDIGIGSHPTCPAGGLYILQDLLPLTAEVELRRREDIEAMLISVSRYQGWARENHEPGVLRDLDHSDQASRIGSTLVLHDVEPLYLAGAC